MSEQRASTPWVPCQQHPLRLGPFVVDTPAAVPACLACECERLAADNARLRAGVAAYLAALDADRARDGFTSAQLLAGSTAPLDVAESALRALVADEGSATP